jgi:hypothetical protein
LRDDTPVRVDDVRSAPESQPALHADAVDEHDIARSMRA